MSQNYILKKYLESISKYKLLTREEEIELAKKIKEGDQESLKKLVNSNLKLVVKIALEFEKSYNNLMDIIQNGNLGLIKAAERFDYKRDVKFSTYAANWIRQSILRGFIKNSTNLTISYRKDEINKKIKNYIKNYCLTENRYPTVDFIVKELRVKRRDAIDVLLGFNSNNKYYNKNNNENPNDLLDNIVDNRYNPEEIAENTFMREDIIKALDKFSDRDKEILLSRFGFNWENKMTLQSLGEKFSISAEATRQIEKRMLNTLRKKYTYLNEYFYI